LSTTNPTWPDPGLNPGSHGGKPVTNCLNYGAALSVGLYFHSPIRLHGVVLNYLITGPTLPLPFVPLPVNVLICWRKYNNAVGIFL
jgi:hypothetical protein